MFDPVLADLAEHTRRLDRRDARDAWVEVRACEIEEEITGSAERFYEVTDMFSEDDWFPLERLLLQLSLSSDEESLTDAALELRLLLRNRTQSVAFAKAQEEAKQHYPGVG